MPGSMSFSWATGRMMFAPLEVCCFITSNSSSVSFPGFFRMPVLHSNFAYIVQQCGDAQAIEFLGVHFQGSPMAREYFATRPEWPRV